MSAPAHDDVPAAIDELIAALPKTELHVHLEGSLQPALLLQLARKHRIPDLPASLEAVRDWYAFRDFPHFIDVFEAAVHTLRDEEDFALLVAQTATTLARQNVRYAEVILPPHLHLARGVPAEAIFGGIEHARVAVERDLGIQLRWIADFPGHWGASSGEATLDAVLHAGLESIVGLSVGGIEVDRDPFAAVFARARAAGLHSVPHAGETHGPDRVWSAIQRLGAERIGHGIRCLHDPALVEHLVSAGIALDVCPTSNLRTQSVASLAQHPLPRMLDAGLTVTLNSDDPPMFATTLLDEYRAAYRMGLSPAALTELARHGVRASFASLSTKNELLAAIDAIEQPTVG